MKETTIMVNETILYGGGIFPPTGRPIKPHKKTVHYAETMQLNDDPIRNSYDLLLAINAAESQIKEIIVKGMNVELLKPYTTPVTDVFANLKTLIFDYLEKVRNEKEGLC